MTPEKMMVKTAHVVNGNLWRCFPAINVDKVKGIPADYPGPMGVPITFLNKFSESQFEIVGMQNHGSIGADRSDLYRRIIIRHLHPALPEEIDLAAWFRRMGVPLDIQFVRSAGELPTDVVFAYRRCACGGQAIVDGRRVLRVRLAEAEAAQREKEQVDI